MCTGGRGCAAARLRTRAHSGSHAVTRPNRSHASQVETSAGPAPSSWANATRAASGHGRGSGGQRRASHSSVPGEMRSPCRAAAAATRSDSVGSTVGRIAARASTTSPSWATTSGAIGARTTGPVRRPWCFWVASQRSAARSESSTAYAMVRASSAIRRRSASGPGTPSSVGHVGQVLHEQPVPAAPGHQVQAVAHVEQAGVARPAPAAARRRPPGRTPRRAARARRAGRRGPP